MEAERRRLREPHDLLERQLAEKRKTEPNFVLRIPDLDRELREKQKLYAELIQVSPQTAKVRQELAWLRERIVAIPNEKSDLRTQHLRTVSEIRALEELLEREKPPVAKIEEEIRLHKEEWAAREAAFAERVKALEAARGRRSRRKSSSSKARRPILTSASARCSPITIWPRSTSPARSKK